MLGCQSLGFRVSGLGLGFPSCPEVVRDPYRPLLTPKCPEAVVDVIPCSGFSEVFLVRIRRSKGTKPILNPFPTILT